MVDALVVFILVELAAFLGFLVGVFYARDKPNYILDVPRNEVL